MKRAWEVTKGAWHFFLSLGLAYEAYVGLGVLGGAALAVYHRASAGQTVRDVAFYCAVAAGVALVLYTPLLYVALGRRPSTLVPMPNPSIWIVSLVSEATVKPNGYHERRLVQIRALKPVREYHFNVGVVGSGEIKVECTRGGKLTGPIRRHDRSLYFVTFDAEVPKADSTHAVELLYTVEGPMMPYSRETMSGAGKYGTLYQSMKFDTVKAEAVFREEEVAATHGFKITGTLDQIFPDASNLYVWPERKVVADRSYVISWILKT